MAVISEFATEIAHVPGLENVVADALTRQFDDVEAPVAVHSVVHCLTDVDLAEIARKQRPIGEERPSSLRLESIRFPGMQEPVICDTSLGRPRILVPESSRPSVFSAVHNLAHPSGKATLAIISRSYAWENMRRDVLRWARNCQACATSKVARHEQPAVRPIPVPAERFDHVHVDIVGPFEADQGYRYILTAIDRTTRWPEATPIADTTADTVLQAFIGGWIARFGVPRTVTSDRGAQFTSETWKAALGRLGINMSATTAYHPQSNGVVERFH